MIFTLYYMYATLLQWWRMGSLKNKLNGTLNSKNALLVCDETVIYDTKKSRSFENLLFRFEERIGCTVVPKQKVNLSQWVAFPRDYRYFPIYFRNGSSKISSPNIYVLLQAVLDTYVKHSADLIQVEKFGELVAWRASDYFEAILKTDLDKLTKLVHCFSQSDVDINHELKLLKIETVDLEGIPSRIKYERKFSKETTLKYSHAPVYWRKFAEQLKEIYSRVRDSTTPKITIENGKSDDIKKVPVSEVKPIKKDGRKSEDKNTLEVGSGDYRRHKSSEHKREKTAEKHKSDLTKTDGPHRSGRSEKEHHKRESRFKEAKAGKDDTDAAELPTIKVKKEKELVKCANDKKQKENADVTANKDLQAIQIKDDNLRSKTEKKKSKTDLEQPIQSKDTVKAENSRTMSKRTTSSEKKLVKSMAVSDDTDGDAKLNSENNDTSEEKSKDCSNCTNSNGVNIDRQSQSNGVLLNRLTGVKPPNILVYADSLVVKENVKAALSSTLNKEKYIIYDFPVEASQMVWTDSTILVVVCGTVSPNLTFCLLQYLLSGGQLLCLCSDLLYSVLHTFTTAEVREHELVRFTYGQWKQVKMMHHIFCYQASPAKKQFSKDSDHSNQSSGNGSSPIAPVTPSTVDIQHNGKDYTIQVQVLGTEEIWQTPSLLLATVKGGEGRAIFSQVHLEINPNQYEDDENKFEALKDSDQARMEILKDILSNHLDIDCCSNADIEYTPAFFLGRYDLKMKLLSDCNSVIENRIECDKLTAKFINKDESPEEATSSYMPIFIHSCPSNFSTVKYFEALETQHIGRLVLYCDLMASSQSVVSKTLTHGLVVIARQQTRAVGRSNNTWLSPLGSANFSLQLHIPLDSPLGKVLPLVQKLAMVAIVSALKTTRGCKDLNIGIKWPNDLYANASVKIGGLLTTSYITDKMAIVNIGCGINLDNPSPTVCINDLIRTSNEKKGTNMKTIPYELYFASVFNEMERIYNIVQNGDIDSLYDLYYKYWLHSDCRITITTKSGESENVMIVGVDDYGFLRVRSQNGSITTVHPDGNTFDMLKGLISPKDF